MKNVHKMFILIKFEYKYQKYQIYLKKSIIYD